MTGLARNTPSLVSGHAANNATDSFGEWGRSAKTSGAVSQSVCGGGHGGIAATRSKPDSLSIQVDCAGLLNLQLSSSEQRRRPTQRSAQLPSREEGARERNNISPHLTNSPPETTAQTEKERLVALLAHAERNESTLWRQPYE